MQVGLIRVERKTGDMFINLSIEIKKMLILTLFPSFLHFNIARFWKR